MSHDLDERLTAELGTVAYRFPPPPLDDVRARAGRRRRLRTARRMGGTAVVAAVVTTVVTSSLTGGEGEVTPAQTPPRSERQCQEWFGPVGGDTLVLPMLPDVVPAGKVLRTVSGGVQHSCGRDVLNAWSVDPATRRVDRWLRVSAVPSPLPQEDDPCALLRVLASGECRRAPAAGETRWILRLRESGERAVWEDAGRIWWVMSSGYDAAEFDAVLARLRTDDANDFVRRGSLPAGLEVWEAPDTVEPRESPRFLAWYVPRGGSEDLNGPDTVTLTALDDPTAEMMDELGDVPATAWSVDVGGRPGFWLETTGRRMLAWRTADGVLLTLSGQRLTLADALATGATVRRVDRDDPRVTCAAGEGRPGGCG